MGKTDLTNINFNDVNRARNKIKFLEIFSMNEKVTSNWLGLTYWAASSFWFGDHR